MTAATGQLRLERVSPARGGRQLTNPITMTCEPGDVVGVVGPNGAGKSSLLAAVAGLAIPHTGRISLDGHSIGSLKPRARAAAVAYLPQDVAAPAEMLAAEVVGIGADATRRRHRSHAIAAALDHLNIGHLARRRFGSLSGGERQLVHVARVIAQDARVVLMDEPTSALDLHHEHAIEDAMVSMAAEGRIVIASLHDLSLSLNACTQVLLLGGHAGVHIGAPDDVLTADLVHASYGVRTSIFATHTGRRILARDHHPTHKEK